MLLASKAAWAAIVLIVVTTGISGPRPAPLASGASLSREVPGVVHRDDLEKMQQTLWGKGHYRGKVDGVFGLRTQASIRAYQKAENLPITGQLDSQTATKLGVRPERREETGDVTTKGKPSAGIKWAKVRGEHVRPYAKRSRQFQFQKAAGATARRHFKVKTTTGPNSE